MDPRPIISVPEAFGDSVKVGRDLTPDEVSFAVWNEVAEGAKGVRYYKKSARPPGRGYANMPGVEARIAHDALNLQLLKPFLRIGDTCDLTVSDNEKVVCKSVLCADNGIAVVALNRDFAGRMEAPSRWCGVEDVRVKITMPVRQSIAQLFEVNQGFRPLQFAQVDGRAEFLVPSIRTVRAYLLLFQRDGDVVHEFCAARNLQNAGDMNSKGHAPLSVEGISELLDQYRTQASRLAAPLLEPGLQLDDERVVGIGLELNALRESALWELATVKGRTAGLDVRKQENTRVALDKAYEALGETVR